MKWHVIFHGLFFLFFKIKCNTSKHVPTSSFSSTVKEGHVCGNRRRALPIQRPAAAFPGALRKSFLVEQVSPMGSQCK